LRINVFILFIQCSNMFQSTNKEHYI
jgi:hypothetical protein